MSTTAQAATKRYRPRYQAPEELLVHSSAAKRYSRSNSTVTTPQRSPTASQEPAPLPMMTMAPPPQQAPVSTPGGPITTPEWIRSFYEHGVVVDVTPKRRIAPSQLVSSSAALAGTINGMQSTPMQTPRPSHTGAASSGTPLRGTSLAVSTPSVFTQRRLQSASPGSGDTIIADSYARAKETTLMFGVDFEEVARRRQALYLSEEGDRFKNAVQRSTASPSRKPDFKSTSLTTLRKDLVSTPRQSFMDILARKKDKERVQTTAETAPTLTTCNAPIDSSSRVDHAIYASSPSSLPRAVLPPTSCRPALPSRPSITTSRAGSVEQQQPASSQRHHSSSPAPTSASSMMQQYLAALSTKIVVTPVPTGAVLMSSSTSAHETKPKRQTHADPAITTIKTSCGANEPPREQRQAACDSAPKPQETFSSYSPAKEIILAVVEKRQPEALSNDAESSNELTTAEASEGSKHDDGEGAVIHEEEGYKQSTTANPRDGGGDAGDRAAATTHNSDHSSQVVQAVTEIQAIDHDDNEDDIEFVVEYTEHDKTPRDMPVVVIIDPSSASAPPPQQEALPPPEEDGDLSRDTLEIREYVTNFRSLQENVVDEDCPFPDIARHDLQVDATLNLVGKLLHHDWLASHRHPNPILPVSSPDQQLTNHHGKESAALRSSLLLLEGGGPSATFEELDASQRAFTQDICEGVLFAMIEYDVADVVSSVMNSIAE